MKRFGSKNSKCIQMPSNSLQMSPKWLFWMIFWPLEWILGEKSTKTRRNIQKITVWRPISGEKSRKKSSNFEILEKSPKNVEFPTASTFFLRPFCPRKKIQTVLSLLQQTLYFFPRAKSAQKKSWSYFGVFTAFSQLLPKRPVLTKSGS